MYFINYITYITYFCGPSAEPFIAHVESPEMLNLFLARVRHHLLPKGKQQKLQLVFLFLMLCPLAVFKAGNLNVLHIFIILLSRVRHLLLQKGKQHKCQIFLMFLIISRLLFLNWETQMYFI